MNKSGWVKHYRKKWDNGYHKDWLLWIMMDYFIDFANHEDKEIFIFGIGKVTIKRGQHLFGTRKLANFLGAPRHQIRTRLEVMKDSDFISIKSTHKYSIATVLNYDKYQSSSPTKAPTESPIKLPQSSTNKNDKKKEKKYSNNSIEFKLSRMLFDSILEIRPKYKKPNFQKWADEVEKMIRIDNRDIKEIQDVIMWISQDSFEKKTVLSTAKLRKRYDDLAIKYDSSGFKRFIEEYTYNNPIWKKIEKESKLSDDQIKKINEDIRKDKANRKSDDEPVSGDKKRWEAKKAETLRKISI